MKKEQFLELCQTNPEKIFKLITAMSETILALKTQVEALTNQVDALNAGVKELELRFGTNSLK